MRKIVLGVLYVIAIAGLTVGVAQAQATRTWVSGVGDDANPCSRTAPCKTFAGAISKTAAGGEISVLDPGGFGGVTITKSITISGDGTLAGILVGGTNGITINAGVNDRVILRNISIVGSVSALNGIRILQARFVTIDQITINNFTGNGVSIENAATASVLIKNSYISNVLNGVRMLGAGTAVASLHNVSLSAMARGVDVASSAATATIDASVIYQTSTAGVATTVGTGRINVENSILSNNVTAVSADVSGSTIRLSNNGIYNNSTGLSLVAGATIASANNNKSAGNTTPGAPNGSITIQ